MKNINDFTNDGHGPIQAKALYAIDLVKKIPAIIMYPLNYLSERINDAHEYFTRPEDSSK